MKQLIEPFGAETWTNFRENLLKWDISVQNSQNASNELPQNLRQIVPWLKCIPCTGEVDAY